MTAALCFRCGTMKIGAYTRGRACGIEPQSPDDLALSILLSDRYVDRADLPSMRQSIAAGEPIPIDSETRSRLAEAIGASESYRKRQLQRERAEAAGNKKPWWQLW